VSRENVEIVRACFEAWRAGDFERSLSYYAEDTVWQTGSVDSAVYRGRAGVARAMKEWVGTFTDYWAEVEDLIDAGDVVVLLFREGGTGRTSGVRVEEEGALVFTLRDGQIVSGCGYTDRAEGLRAAGLDEPG
jgi:ketosteroid isomerase-like protein